MSITIPRRNIQRLSVSDHLVARFLRIRLAVKQARVRRARYLQTVAELSSLSDHELADLAIPRSHIRRLAIEDSRKGTEA